VAYFKREVGLRRTIAENVCLLTQFSHEDENEGHNSSDGIATNGVSNLNNACVPWTNIQNAAKSPLRILGDLAQRVRTRRINRSIWIRLSD
jgi:hypothetical protein